MLTVWLEACMSLLDSDVSKILETFVFFSHGLALLILVVIFTAIIIIILCYDHLALNKKYLCH